MQNVANERELFELAKNIPAGTSQKFQLRYQPTKQDIQVMKLRLARHRSGGTFSITKTGPNEIQVSAMEAVKAFSITGLTSDIKYLDSPYRTRRI